MARILLGLSAFLLWSGGLCESTQAQAAPCCEITAVSAQTGIVSAKVNATNATFHFKAPNAKVAGELRAGRGVYANFSTKQVSLDGRSPCCEIVSAVLPSTASPQEVELHTATKLQPPVPMQTSQFNAANSGPDGRPPALQVYPPCSGSLPSSVLGGLAFELDAPTPMPLPFPGCTMTVEFYKGVQLQRGWSVTSVNYESVQSTSQDEFKWLSQPSGTSAQGSFTITIPPCPGPYQCVMRTFIFEVSVSISGPQGTDPYPPQPLGQGRLITVPTLRPVMGGSASGTSSTSGSGGTSSGTPAKTVCAGPATLRGVDVSVYQGTTTNWNKVRESGIAFAYAVVGKGIQMDAMFPTNYAGIKAAGLARGVLQGFDAFRDPYSQATVMINAVGTLKPGDLPPALDLEFADIAVSQGQVSAQTVVDNVNIWIARVQAATGVTPIVSLAAFMLQPSISGLAPHSLWIADWNTVQCPTLPAGANQWLFWQHSGTGTVPGIAPAVDLDTFNGTEADLKSLWK